MAEPCEGYLTRHIVPEGPEPMVSQKKPYIKAPRTQRGGSRSSVGIRGAFLDEMAIKLGLKNVAVVGKKEPGEKELYKRVKHEPSLPGTTEQHVQGRLQLTLYC